MTGTEGAFGASPELFRTGYMTETAETMKIARATFIMAAKSSPIAVIVPISTSFFTSFLLPYIAAMTITIITAKWTAISRISCFFISASSFFALLRSPLYSFQIKRLLERRSRCRHRVDYCQCHSEVGDYLQCVAGGKRVFHGTPPFGLRILF